ncbi:MAG: M20 metallopeptidase family protein [Fusobacteriaceae bacterium]
MNNLLEQVKDIENWLIEVRRDFHQFPELGENEFRTMDKIVDYLEEMGISYKKNIFKTGVIADIQGIDPSITIAFRGDMDALPILDLKQTDYASKNKGVCHACGHDTHMTMNLGIARYFFMKKIVPPCNIRLIFQPAEETVGGAKPMIEAGALEGVDFIYGIHISEEISAGQIMIKYGSMNASSDTLIIKVKGKSCHGAYPSDGVDAIVIASNLIVALQSVVSRNIDSRESAVITIGKISGGTAGNIVADCVELRGTLRTLNPETRAKALDKIRTLVETLPLAFGGVGEFIREESYTSLINHDLALDIVKANGIALLGESNVIESKVSKMGVEDFAYFVEKVPGAMFNVGSKNIEKNIVAPAHNGAFDVDESSLAIGVAMEILNLYSTYEKIIESK